MPGRGAIVVDRRRKRAGTGEPLHIAVDVGLAERVRPGGRGTEQSPQQRKIPRAQRRLRQQRQLEERRIPAAEQLRWAAHLPLEDGWMRRVQNDEPVEQLRVCGREVPCDDPAPVVTHDMRTLRSRRQHHRANIRDEVVDRVGLHSCRCARAVVAAQVRRDGRESGSRERLHLMPPRRPVLRKAVQEYDGRTGSDRGDVNGDRAVVDGGVCDCMHSALPRRGRGTHHAD